MATIDSLRTSRSFLIALALSGMLLSTPASGQSILKIYGQVINADGPVGGAEVFIENTSFKTVADQDGYYRFLDIPPGRYRLRCFSGSGAASATGVIETGIGPAVRQDIYLDDNVVNIGPLYIEAERRPSLESYGLKAKVYEIDGGGIGSIDEALGRIPGFNLVKSSATGEVYLSVAGIRPEGVNILVDGRKINSLLTGRADLNQLPLEAVTRVEYYTPGTAGSAVEGGLGGTVNFVTMSGPKPDLAMLNAARGSFGLEDYSFALSVDKKSWGGAQGVFETGFSKNEYEYTDYFGDSQVRLNAFEKRDKYYLSYANEFKGNYLKLSGYHYRSRNGVPGQIITPSMEASSAKQSSSLALDISRFIGKSLMLAVTASFQERSTHYRDSGGWIPYDNEYHEKEFDIAVTGEQQAGSGLAFVQKLSYSDDYLNGTDEIRPDMSLGGWHRRQHGFYAGMNYRKNIEPFSVETGMSGAWDRVDRAEYTSGSLSGAVIYHGLFDLGLTSAYSGAFRLPGLAEIHWQEDVFAIANPELEPERSRSFTNELFCMFNIAGRWRIAAEYRDIRYDDLIYWRRSQGMKFKPVNVSKSDFFNTTVSLKYESPREYVTADFSRESSLPLNRESDELYFGKFITFQPLYINRLSLKLKYKNPYAKLDIHDTGKRYTTEENTKALNPFTLADLSFGFDLNYKWLRVSWQFSINNLTDADYEYLEYQPMPPRNYRLSMDIKI